MDSINIIARASRHAHAHRKRKHLSTAAMHSCVALENSWLWLVGSDLWHVKPTARTGWHCASVQLD